MYRFLFLLWLFPAMLFAGIDPSEIAGSRASALAQSYTAVNGDFWSLFHNPAGIAGLKNPQAGIFFCRQFNLRELTRNHAGFVLPFGDNQAAGLEAGSYGFDAWRENLLAFSYAITIAEKISLGAKVNYLAIVTADAGSVSTAFVTVGTQTKINDQLSLGFSAVNVNRATIKGYAGKEEILSLFSAGILYQPSEKVLLVADVHKSIAFPLNWSGGLEYVIIPALLARVGVSTHPLTFNSGLGLKLENIALDFAFSYHERLGYTPHISLCYQFARKRV